MPEGLLRPIQRNLGRVYPSDLEGQILALSKRLDDMMASSVDLATFADTDLSGKISELNASLVNDVVLPSDELTDEEAKSRLAAIQADADSLAGVFSSNGVQIGTGAGQLTADVLSSKQASDLTDQMQKAFNVYSGIAERMGLASPMITSALVLPGTGAKVSSLLSDIQSKLASIGSALDSMHKYSDQLDSAPKDSTTGAVTFDRAKAAEMQRFIAQVLQADEILKRIEGLVLKKPVAATPAASAPLRPGSVPVAIIAIAGITLVGLAYWAIADNGKKKK